MPLAAMLLNQYESWTKGGALVSEMEAAALFITAAVLKVRAGAIILVASNKWMKTRLKEEENHQAMDEMIEYTLAAVRQLEKQRGV